MTNNTMNNTVNHTMNGKVNTMLDDLSVARIRYNKITEKMEPCSWSLADASAMLRHSVMKALSEMEEGYMTMYGKKETWPAQAQEAYGKLRHRMLDIAGSLHRLPEELRYKGKPCNAANLTEWIASTLDVMTVKENA